MNEPPRPSRVPRSDSGGPANPAWKLRPAPDPAAEPGGPGPGEAAGDPGGGGAGPPPPLIRPAPSASGDSGQVLADLPDAIKISMWGSPNSGKTTYLAALDQAVIRPDKSTGHWGIFPADEPSQQQLLEWSRRLVKDREFPARTEFDERIQLKWLFKGNLTGSRYERKRRGRRRKPGQSESSFLLDVVDVSGEAFSSAPEKDRKVPKEIMEEALKKLIEADGLIYLFDPVTERDSQEAADYMFRTLTALKGAMIGKLDGPYLPKDIAVCVTKFDHAQLFTQARRSGLVNFGPDGMPRVLDQHAEQFFDSLCEGDFWSEHDGKAHPSASFVRDQLKHFFHPDRINYYVTSSIGFWKPPDWNPKTSSATGFEFDPKNFENIEIEPDGTKKIRGVIRPINVLEPLISLQQRLAART
jgi:hypothetical protein